MEHVLAEKNLFDPFPAHKVTMQQVVFRTRRIMRYEMLPIVEAEIAHSSAREDLRQLQISASAALGHLISFLYNIFRDGGGPVTMTVSKLRNPSGEKYEKILQNRSGFLLNKLMQSGLFATVFKDDHFQLEDGQKAVADGMMNMRTDTVYANDFLDARGNVKIPKWLLDWDTDPKERAATDLTNLFDHEDSGVEDFFRGQPMITGAFLRCHGLAQEMAKFILVVEKAHRLAGQGGDLLVYGVANAQVNAMLQTYESLTRAVRASVDRLNQIAEIHFERLVNENQARDSSSKWIKHFKKISFTIELLTTDLERADAAALHVRGQANSMTLYDRLQKAKAETQNFVAQAEGYSKHVAGVLGLDYQAPMRPVIIATDEKSIMASADAPFGMSSSSSSGALAAPSAVYGQGMVSTPLGIAAAPTNPLGDIYKGNAGKALSLVRSASTDSENAANQDPTELIMVKAGITDSSINRVFIRLGTQTARLSLEDNRLTGTGGLMLFEHIHKYCPTVKSLNLYKNNLGGEGARALAAALTRPDFLLTRLDLNENDLGDEGAQFIISGLMANHTLTHLDLGYNGITDEGICDLPMVLDQEDCAIKFMMLSGNTFTAAPLVPLYEIYQRRSNLVVVDIGDPSDNKVPPAIAEKFQTIAHPRRHAYNSALQAAFDAEKAREAEPKLRRIDAASAAPVLKTRIKSLPPGQQLPVATSKKSSGVIIEEVDDEESGSSSSAMVRGGSIGSTLAASATSADTAEDEEEPEIQLQVEDYYPLIRVIQLLQPVCSTKEFGCVAKKTLIKAFDCSAYGLKLPDITMTVEEYYELARVAGVVEVREIKKKGYPSKIGLTLADQWKNYKVPLPPAVTHCTPKVWQKFIKVCQIKPKAVHKKSSLLTWTKTVKPELQSEAEDVLSSMIDLAIYSGTLIMDLKVGKYTPNLEQKRYPIDRAVCPPFEF